MSMSMTQTEYDRLRAERLRELHPSLQNEVAEAKAAGGKGLLRLLEELDLVEKEATMRGVDLNA
jgi:hypothetical protein